MLNSNKKYKVSYGSTAQWKNYKKNISRTEFNAKGQRDTKLPRLVDKSDSDMDETTIIESKKLVLQHCKNSWNKW